MPLHPSLDNQELSEKHCFLCGVESESLTEEHVIPKWLQKKYDLWDERLTLLNGTPFQYRNLKVPCCCSCNGGHLSRLEGMMKDAVEGGYSSAVKLDKELWFQWTAKVLYGIWRKEFSLLLDHYINLILFSVGLTTYLLHSLSYLSLFKR